MMSRAEKLAALYLSVSGRGREVSFAEFLQGKEALDDGDLAELIEADGRLRLDRGMAVRLERYLTAVNDLADRPAALDAAIDVTLRSLSRAGQSMNECVEGLVLQYPDHADAIFDAAALNKALMSTQGFQKELAEVPRHREIELPHDLGPLITVQEQLGDDESECVERTMPRYRLERFLGEGAFGRVYLAVDRQLSEEGHPARVAVKVLSATNAEQSATAARSTSQRTPGSPWARQRLMEEATKARRVSHPNVVRVLDRGVSDEDEDFIVYELVEGGDLGRHLQQHARNPQKTRQPAGGPMQPREAAAMMARIARGVQAAHAAGLVHCDLKPGNIMLSTDGEPKVADFGIAIRRHATNESQQRPQAEGGERTIEHASLPFPAASHAITHASHPVGNLAFVSPEQYRMEEGSLTIPSDIYALGGILYLMLTGLLPNGSTVEAIARTHHPEIGRQEPPRLRDVQPQFDADLERICMRAMALRPEDRYSSAGALADDLEAWLRHEPLYWMQPSFLHVARLWVKRKPAVAAVTALLAASLLTAAVVVNHYSHEAERSARLAERSARLADQEAAAKEIERIRADAEVERRAYAARHLRRLYQSFERLSQARSTQVFPLIWTIEHVLGPDVMSVPVAGSVSIEQEMVVLRLDAARGLVEQAEERGATRHLDAMLWRTMFAFWLIKSDEPQRAETMLRELRTEWAEMLRPDDRWLEQIDVMTACAALHRLAPRARDAKLDQDEIDQVQRAEALIAEHEAQLDAEDAGNALHHLILETQLILYGPAWLNEPEKARAVRTQLESVITGSARQASGN